MLKCAFCGRRLEATAAWKGHGERYYCNAFCAEEAFCAEADQPDWPLLVGRHGAMNPSVERGSPPKKLRRKFLAFCKTLSEEEQRAIVRSVLDEIFL